MSATAMIELVNRQPFEPLEVHLSDGQVLWVESPHLIATGRNTSTLTLFSDEDESARYVAYRNITQVITKDPAET